MSSLNPPEHVRKKSKISQAKQFNCEVKESQKLFARTLRRRTEGNNKDYCVYKESQGERTAYEGRRESEHCPDFLFFIFLRGGGGGGVMLYNRQSGQ